MDKRIILALILVSFLMLSGCEELIEEIVASAKVKAAAEAEGKMTFCPEERPYRVGGLAGVCVDEDGLSEFIDLKLHGTDDEQKAFVKTTKALQKGQDKECPEETPYYVTGFLFFGGKCVSKADFNQYLADGTLDKEDEEEREEDKPEAEAKSCHYDSDCDPVCEGSIAWKQGCNPRTGKCEHTFERDCGKSSETFDIYTFRLVCENGECVRDTEAIQTKRQDLVNLRTAASNDLKALTAKKQTAQQVMMDANKNCINGLAEVTNKLIIDTGLSLASPAKKLADVASDVTNSLLDEMVDDSKRMSAEEFIAKNCQLYESLKKDIISMEAESERLQDEAKKITERINSLPK